MVSSIDVHGARAADALPAGSSKTESWVNFVFDFDKSIQKHGATVVHVNIVRDVLGSVLWVIWVGSIDVEPFHLSLLLLGEALVELLGVVNFGNLWGVENANIVSWRGRESPPCKWHDRPGLENSRQHVINYKLY